jgi:hypothetical protein
MNNGCLHIRNKPKNCKHTQHAIAINTKVTHYIFTECTTKLTQHDVQPSEQYVRIDNMILTLKNLLLKESQNAATLITFNTRGSTQSLYKILKFILFIIKRLDYKMFICRVKFHYRLGWLLTDDTVLMQHENKQISIFLFLSQHLHAC